MDIRVLNVTLTEVHSEAGHPVSPPARKVVAAADVANPLAGRRLVADLAPLEEMSAEVSAVLAQRVLEVLASAEVTPDQGRGYGKGAIVGTNAELEHTAAVLHPRFGAPVRAGIGGGADIIPGTKQVGAPGSAITMPIGNRDDRWAFDDMDRAEITFPDGPRDRFNVLDEDAPFDGIAELRFDSPEAADAAYATEIGKAVAADSMAHVASRVRMLADEQEVP